MNGFFSSSSSSLRLPGALVGQGVYFLVKSSLFLLKKVPQQTKSMIRDEEIGGSKNRWKIDYLVISRLVYHQKTFGSN